MDKSGIWVQKLSYYIAAATIICVCLHVHTDGNQSAVKVSSATNNNFYVTMKLYRVKMLVNMPKPYDWHIKLLLFGGCHYDLIVAMNQER